MHQQSRCHACGEFNEFPINKCRCSKADIDKFHVDNAKAFEMRFDRNPSIEECKAILLANGYIVKKNPKRKKKKR